jgi:hypothetical protein
VRRILPLLLALLWVGRAQAQVDESDLRAFGYFQNIWYYQKTTKNDGSEQKLDSFSVQQLNLFLQRDLPQINCFANQLNQVFMNIINNAAQAIDGSGKITLRHSP